MCNRQNERFDITENGESVQSKQRPEVDALAEIAALAQPIGPSDLTRNFDLYARRVLIDEIPEPNFYRRTTSSIDQD